MGRITLASDNFNRADSLDLGAAWDRYSGVDGLRIVGNEVRPDPPAAAVDNFESYNGVSLPNDQWASIRIVTCVSAADVDFLYVGCRWAAPNTVTGYLLVVGWAATVPSLAFVQYTTGTFVELHSINTAGLWVAGDTVLLEAVTVGGNAVLTGYVNGVQKLTFTDTASPFLSGRALIGAYNTTAGNAELDDFACGDFSLAPPAPLDSARRFTTAYSRRGA